MEDKNKKVPDFKDIFRNVVESFNYYNRAEKYYELSNLASSRKGETILGACPAGEERSVMFNTSAEAVGFGVAKVSESVRHDADHPLHIAKEYGLSLYDLSRLLPRKDTTLVDSRLRISGFDRPVDRLVLIAQPNLDRVLENIAKGLSLKVKIGEKLPIRVDIVYEPSVEDFSTATAVYMENLS